MLNHKQAAIDFLELVIAGTIDQAYKKYIDMNGKHHNTVGLRPATKSRLAQFRRCILGR